MISTASKVTTEADCCEAGNPWRWRGHGNRLEAIDAIEQVITEWAGPHRIGEGMTAEECLERIRAIVVP